MSLSTIFDLIEDNNSYVALIYYQFAWLTLFLFVFSIWNIIMAKLTVTAMFRPTMISKCALYAIGGSNGVKGLLGRTGANHPNRNCDFLLFIYEKSNFYVSNLSNTNLNISET